MAREMIAVVTGGRDNWDVPDIEGVLDSFGPFVRLYHGGATGADTVAAGWAESRDIPTEAFPADWHTHGKRAGPIRNGAMLRAAKAESEFTGVPVSLFAFDGGAGTADCIRQAKALGIEIVDAQFRTNPQGAKDG